MNIPWAKPFFRGNEEKYLLEALKSTWISGGYYVDEFESKFSKLHDMEFGLTTSNGTTALQLANIALNINAGDEVIVPGFSFVAPGNMVIVSGATPIYADIDPKTWLMDSNSVASKITKRTKVIIPVHTYGNLCEMDTILSLAREHRLRVIEDVAEAAFSKYKGRYAGTFGDINAFSFQSTKTITMGEGGIVLTNHQELFEKMKLIRNHGMQQKKYWHEIVAFNFRLTNMQAAIGCAQLENIETIITERARVYEIFRGLLSEIDGIEMQYFPPYISPVVWALGIKINSKAFRGDRDYLIEQLSSKGIETRPGFYPYSEMPIYKAPHLPVCSDVAANIIALPFYPSLSEEEIIYICEQLIKLKR